MDTIYNPPLVRGSALPVFQVTLKFPAGETRLAHPSWLISGFH